MRAALTLVIVASLAAAAAAQPADKPDFAHAAEVYKQAEAEMAAGQYSDAARDYGIAFDITKDPVLFFKIATADDKAGRCELALTYYRRYLAEGKPSAEFEKLTNERIEACEHTSQRSASTVPDPQGPSPTPDPTTTGSTDGTTAPATTDDPTALSTERPSLAAEKPNKMRGAAWIVLGVGVALGTVAAVSAMSAEAAEKDLQDLYDIRVSGRPPEYTADISDREHDLIDQGERYQTLSWVAFGVSGVALAGATVLFIMSARDDDESPPPVSLRVSGDGATVSGGWTF